WPMLAGFGRSAGFATGPWATGAPPLPMVLPSSRPDAFFARKPFVLAASLRYPDIFPPAARCRPSAARSLPPTIRPRPLIASLCLLAFLAFAYADGPSAPARKVDFGRDVRPILSDACFACHGPDAKKRKADLRLDVFDGTLQKNKIIVAG